MNRPIALLCCLLTAPAFAADGEALLDAALERHDPEGAWSSAHLRWTLESSRPDGSRYRTVIELDNARGTFHAEQRRSGTLLEATIGPGDHCELRLDGSTEIPAERSEALRFTCARWRMMRDYYSYMWGLPMKLRDPGTRIDAQVASATFQGRESRALRVTYDGAVGKDIWYIYHDPGDARVVGYRFHHDEAAGDGEYIVLDGEVRAGSLRFPRRHTWYTNAEDRLLGSDELIEAQLVE